MTAERPLCVLIGALGGQGGGVLTDWLVEAARAAGYPAQATSIPGVAQRTGATTYYFELFPQRHPPGDPVFSLFPSTGDVDLVAALEPTEAGKALEQGYVGGRTVVVTSTQHVYSTAEKSVAGDGVVDVAPVLQALAQAARRLIPVAPSLAPDSQGNALLFGAIVGSGVLPLSPGHARTAIESRGLAAAANLAGMEAGLVAARGDGRPANGFPRRPPLQYDPPPAALAPALAQFPEALQPLLGHGVARLVDYQDEAYARRFLARLEPVLAADGAANGYRLTAEVARRLAAWMSYEDVIRVAQLKTRPGRLARIRAEVGARPGDPVQVVDFLFPGRGELLSLLPASLARLVPGGNGKGGAPGRGVPLAWPTSSFWGYAALKFLASLRRLRPRSELFAREQAASDKWLQAVVASASYDYTLACQVAEVAVWARGYGEVRARGLACLDSLFSDWSRRLAADVAAVRAAVDASLDAARNDPDNFCTP